MRISTTGTLAATPTTSSRFTAGIIVINKVGVATALAATEQIGQICVLITPEFMSTQQCICAAKNTSASSTATK